MESRTVVVVDWRAVVVELWTKSVAEGIDSAGSPEREHATSTIRTRGRCRTQSIVTPPPRQLEGRAAPRLAPPLSPPTGGEKCPKGGFSPGQNGVSGAPGLPLSPAPG